MSIECPLVLQPNLENADHIVKAMWILHTWNIILDLEKDTVKQTSSNEEQPNTLMMRRNEANNRSKKYINICRICFEKTIL